MTDGCSVRPLPGRLESPPEETRVGQPNSQTYVAILGDQAPFLQVPQVVFAVVELPQMRVMQAVVLCAQIATVRISQVKLRRRLVELEEMCCRV